MNTTQTLHNLYAHSYAIGESRRHGMIARLVCPADDLEHCRMEAKRQAGAAGMLLRCEYTTPTLVLCSAYYPSRGPQAPEWRVEIEAA